MITPSWMSLYEMAKIDETLEIYPDFPPKVLERIKKAICDYIRFNWHSRVIYTATHNVASQALEEKWT